MSRKIYDVIEAVLALPRAKRVVVMERLKESLEQPDVPGGTIVEPQDLVELGARYVFPKNRRYQRETVTLTSKAARRGWGPTRTVSRSQCFSTSACSHTRRAARAK